MPVRTQYLPVLFLVVAMAFGCQATQTASKKVRGAAHYLGSALFDSLFEPNETMFEKDAREKNERAWKQHWRDHPEEAPAMTERYKDDYK